MAVEIKEIDVQAFEAMLESGAHHLSKEKETINALNVFPVPDGDTGTNMSLTMSAGVKYMRERGADEVGACSQAFSKGLLMGARGNSGVILSQLFRGVSQSVARKHTLNATDFSQALESGVKSAYNAVMKPVEGTILTVAKDAARAAARETAAGCKDFGRLLESVVRAAHKSLESTPEKLPVLKEAGVVDSGGKGLVTIYEGFLKALNGEADLSVFHTPTMDELVRTSHHQVKRHDSEEKAIEFGFCTEIMVRFPKGEPDEAKIRKELSGFGDSLIAVADGDLLKVHIHTETPGEVLTKGQTYGELIKIKIDNMREQNAVVRQNHAASEQKSTGAKKRAELKNCAVVTVTAGVGLSRLFKSTGAEVVLEGGQTMNPSTEDLVRAIQEANARHVIVLPNNSNIQMAAEQAADLAECKVAVVPSKTVPQGLAALLRFDPARDFEANQADMRAAVSEVISGQITKAVRDTTLEGVTIKEGDYLGIMDGRIVEATRDRTGALVKLANKMAGEDNELITLIYGEEVSADEAEKASLELQQHFSDFDIEIHEGGQPVYDYLVSVE